MMEFDYDDLIENIKASIPKVIACNEAEKAELNSQEPERMGGGDSLLLRIVMTLLMPVFWLIDKFKKGCKPTKGLFSL